MPELLIADFAGLLSDGTDSRGTPSPAESWTLDRPQVLNALNPALVTAMHEALVRAEQVGRRVVVLRGAGSSFCAGADLAYLSANEPRAFLEQIWQLTIAMERSPVIFVAALHGNVVAGGLELALACDAVLSSDDARIGDGHVRNNLVPGGGASARMERALGRGTSAWLGLTGELLPASDPRLSSWLHAVVPVADLDHATGRVVDRLLAVHAPAQQRYKRMLHVHAGSPGDAEMKTELDEFDDHWHREDVPAALHQFLTRRRELR